MEPLTLAHRRGRFEAAVLASIEIAEIERPHYLRWVSQFLNWCSQQALSFDADASVERWLAALMDRFTPGWQLAQARRMARLVYGCGLRLEEWLSLRIKDALASQVTR